MATLTEDGFHSHTCPNCDAVWRHRREDLTDSAKAHTCPECGCQDDGCYFRDDPVKEPTTSHDAAEREQLRSKAAG